MFEPSPGVVAAVSAGPTHSMAKPTRRVIRLLTGLGVEGDAHLGVTVQHRSRVRRDPAQPNPCGQLDGIQRGTAPATAAGLTGKPTGGLIGYAD